MAKGSGWPRRARIAGALVFALVFAAAFSGGSVPAARALRIEFVPALLRCAAAFSLGALATVLALALPAWLFGRFYCAALCPLGIWQDAVGRLSRRKSRPERNRPRLRYLIAGVSCGMLAGGWTLPFLLLDPYSNAGRIVAGGLTLGGVLPLVLITLLAVWKKRLFCTAICPAGTLLGLFARRGVLKLRLTEKCVKCGSCVKVCPAGCVDPASGTLDNERCVRCMNCLAACGVGGVEYTARGGAPVIPTDRGRREFLIDGGCFLAGLGAGFAVARLGLAVGAAVDSDTLGVPILPPGAADAARFKAKCTACQLCTANCPEKIIVPAPGGYGPVRLDLERGACRSDCDRCSAVCPTGALLPLGLERKRRTRIALAEFDPRKCLVFQEGEKCGKCAAACPTGAVTLRKSGAPRFKADKCIGCGACRAACPAPGKAFRVVAVRRQELLEA